MSEFKEFCIDFGIPAMLIIGSFVLIATGIDGEVKTILTLSAGWAFHSGLRRRNNKKNKK